MDDPAMTRDCVQLLERLVAFPTVSRDSNLALIDFVRERLAESGVECELFFNEARTKASLFATIGPDREGGIALSGHTDVVPVDGQAWSSDPFSLVRRGDRLYGRGTADMKGFIACVLAAVPAMQSEALRAPIHLSLSYDEEVGCVGVRPMLAELSRRANRPRICLIGEPTEMKPVLGHKGKLAMRCRVQGAACHSAHAPKGVNAIEVAARLIHRLTQLGEDLARPARRDARFDPPFSTVQTGLIRGGRALNIVPAECEFDFEVRALPGLEPREVSQALKAYADAELLPRMRQVHPEAGICWEALGDYPGLATPPDSPAARLLARLLGSTAYGTVSYGTEGGLFSHAGIATVVCGPGSMDQGHKPDEFITLEQLGACASLLARLVEHLRHEGLDPPAAPGV